MVELRRKPTHSKKTAERRVSRKTGQQATARRKTSVKKSASKPSPKRWSQRVTQESDALDPKHGVFKLTDPKQIATSLKRSA
jgi:hypothetical protein